MKKQMLFGDFRALAAKELEVPLERQRWWKWAKRQNGTLRPTSPLADADDALTVLDVCRARPRGAAPSALAVWLSTSFNYCRVTRRVAQAAD